ncbi:MAG: hypothetical protein ACETWK_11240 [Candidatus Aminicenantaceae bacterium]
MSRLVFIKNNIQLKLLLRYYSEFLNNENLIMTSSLIEWIKLRKLCRNNLLYTGDFIERKEFNRIINESNSLAFSWHESIKDLLDYRNINLGDVVRVTNVEFLREVLAMTLVIRRVIERFRVEEVILFRDLDTYFVYSTLKKNTHSTPEAVISWETDKRNIPKQYLKLKNKETEGNISFKAIRRYKSIVANMKRIFLSRRFRRFAPNFWQYMNSKRIVGIGNLYDLLIVSAFVHEWNKASDKEGILLNFGERIDMKKLPARAGIIEYGDLKHVSFNNFRTLPMNRSIIKKLNNAYEEWLKSRNQLDHSNPIANPYLDFQWEYIWNVIKGLAYDIDTAYAAWKALEPDVVITSDWISPFPRVIIETARQEGIMTVASPHGWIGAIESYEPQTDLFLTWGELSESQLKDRFPNVKTHFKVCGSPANEVVIRALSRKHAEKVRDKFGIDNKKKTILLLTGNDSTGVFNLIQSEKFQLIWERWIEFAQNNPNVQIIIKPKPLNSNDFHEWYKELVDHFSLSNLFLIENEKLENLLPLVNLTVLVEIFTTAGYLCMASGIPVLVSHYARKYFRETEKPWIEKLSVADTIDDFFQKVKSFLHDEKCIHDHIKRQNIFLGSSLSMTEVPSSKRAVDEIIKVLK